MPSPFPGMDPWLESPHEFYDLRFSFVVRLSAALNSVLPDPFYSRFGFRIWFEPMTRGRAVPDAVVQTHTGPGPIQLPKDGTLWDERREGFVEIRSGREGSSKIWTRLDIPSRENKAPGHPSRVLYRCRQREDLWEGVNRVEIDILRDGEHTTLAPAHLFPRPMSEAPYHICVHRRADENFLTVYQFGPADPWPKVAVPIGEEHSDVDVDLAAVFDDCYRGAAYGRWVHYDRPCDPPLTDDQRTWAESILRAKGLMP